MDAAERTVRQHGNGVAVAGLLHDRRHDGGDRRQRVGDATTRAKFRDEDREIEPFALGNVQRPSGARTTRSAAPNARA